MSRQWGLETARVKYEGREALGLRKLSPLSHRVDHDHGWFWTSFKLHVPLLLLLLLLFTFSKFLLCLTELVR